MTIKRCPNAFSWRHVLPLTAVVLGACFVMVATTGCTSSPNAGKYAYRTAGLYYNQPNTAEIESIQVQEGGSYSVEIKGPASVVRSAPIPTKNIIPQNPSIANTAIEWIGRLGLGWLIADGFQEIAETTVVSQPAPTIVTQPAPVVIPAGL